MGGLPSGKEVYHVVREVRSLQPYHHTRHRRTRARRATREGLRYVAVIERSQDAERPDDMPIFLDQIRLCLEFIREEFNEARVEHVRNSNRRRHSQSPGARAGERRRRDLSAPALCDRRYNPLPCASEPSRRRPA